MAAGLESRTRPVTDTTPDILFDVNGGKKDE